MKIVVIGGTGLIGKKLVSNLQEKGHEAVPASPKSGVDTVTGEGLGKTLSGSQVVVDVSNSPSFEDEAVLRFFETSTRNLLAAAKAAGVGHVVALSVVGSNRLVSSGYMRAKSAQEKLIRNSGQPYSILHSTQFFEFAGSIAQAAAEGAEVRLPPALVQPIASADVAEALTDLALGTPLDGSIDVAGPEKFRMDEWIQIYLTATNDPRRVVADPHARYFGAELDDQSLIPGGKPRIAATKFRHWLEKSAENVSIHGG